jgi:hypothetical protein
MSNLLPEKEQTYQMRYYTLGKIFPIILLSLFLFNSLPAHTSNNKVLLLPLAVYAERPLDHIRKGAASMLTSRLAGGGIAVIGEEGIERYLDEEERRGITSEKRAEELIRKLDADYAIFGTITAVGSKYSLDFSLLKSEKGDLPLTRFSKVVDEERFIPEFSDVANQLRAAIEGKRIAQRELSKPPVLPKTSPPKGIFSKLEDDKERLPDEERGIVFKPTPESKPLQPTGTIPLQMEVMSFDMGDLDGDGNVELVIVDREKMLVYKREGKSFVLIDTRKTSWGEEFFKVSVGDIDNNGKAEICVVSLYGMRARSSVFECASEFTRLSRMIGHLRIVKDPIEMTTLLLFQGSEVNQFFSGPICHMNYGGKGKLNKGQELPDMRGAQFYTLVQFDLNEDGTHEWVGLGKPNLDDKSRLHVWGERGQLLWRGKRELGGTNNAIRAGEAAPEGLPPRISFNSRLVIADIDGDGRRDVVAIENIPMIGKLLNFKVYVKSQLIAYRVEGITLSPAGTTGEIDYCVTDMQSDGQSLFLAAHKGKVSNIGKKSGLIMWFE